MTTHPRWTFLHPAMSYVQLGYIPGWLDADDPASAREQINKNYQYGGWRPFDGFKLRPGNALSYPGDPTIMPLAQTWLRDELIVFYPHAWVAVIQPDRSFEVARID